MSTNTEQKQTAILEDGAHSRGDRSRNVGAHSSLGMSLAGLRGGTSLLLSIISARGGSMSATGTQSTATKEGASLVVGFWGVRYQVKDVRRSISFYTEQLGFKLDQENLPAFGQVSFGNLKLILSGPKASGSRPMPDGRQQQPGGWNRVILQVSELPARIETLKAAGLHFRNEMEEGPGGKQIQLEDPDGNPIELLEPARR